MSCCCPECNNDWGGDCLYAKINWLRDLLKSLDVDSMIQQAHDAAQVIEGWRNTTPTEEWSLYDQLASAGISTLLANLYEFKEKMQKAKV